MNADVTLGSHEVLRENEVASRANQGCDIAERLRILPIVHDVIEDVEGGYDVEWAELARQLRGGDVELDEAVIRKALTQRGDVDELGAQRTRWVMYTGCDSAGVKSRAR